MAQKMSYMIAGAAGFAGLSWWWQRTTSVPPRTAYHCAAERDPSTFLTNRTHMLGFFTSDIEKKKKNNNNNNIARPSSPPLRPLTTKQEEETAENVRVLQWNVNVLMGKSGRDPVQPKDIAKFILETKPDVVLLQEAGKQRFQEDLASGYSTYYQQTVARLNGRVAKLQSLLREAGYTVVVDDNDSSENPALLASRLDVVDKGESFSIDEKKYADATKGDSRSGRFVRVALRGGSGDHQLGFLVTHLHHTERGESRGVRRWEVTTLLRKWRENASKVGATLLGSDLNYPRQCDHSPREWAVVRAGYEQLGEPTEGDGVAELLTDADFRCAYDISLDGAGTPSFTHWTGTTVDFAWLHCRDEARWEVLRSEALPTQLSDHLPVVTDLRFKCQRSEST